MVTPAQEAACIAFDSLWADVGERTGRRPLHVPETVALSIGLHDAGEELGGINDDAREMARIAETVRGVLAQHGRAGNSR